MSLAHCSTRLSVFFLFICRIYLYILDVSSLPDISVVNIFYLVEIKSLGLSSETLYLIAHSRSLLRRQTLYSKIDLLFLDSPSSHLTYPFLKLSPNQKLASFFIQLPRPILLNPFFCIIKDKLHIEST